MKKRPNPAVAQAERAAQSSEVMAELAEKNPRTSSLPRRIASQKRATANKIRKEHPYLTSYGE